MKSFNEPKLELSKLDLEDVICTSTHPTTVPGEIIDPDAGEEQPL